MSEAQRVGDLEITQDLEFQKRSWKAQRVGWAVIALLILGGLLGVFGRGFAARAVAGYPDSPVSFEYERFTPSQSTTSLLLRLGAGVDRVSISKAYLERVQIEAITPQPEAVEARGTHYTYIFRRTANANEPITVVIHVRPQGFGLLSGEVGVEGVITHGFWQLIYP